MWPELLQHGKGFLVEFCRRHEGQGGGGALLSPRTMSCANAGIVIDLDNGPKVQSRRTPFMKRLIEFADRRQLEIELVYYPPYHSKYHPVERCGSSWERHGNGTLLIEVVCNAPRHFRVGAW